MIDNFRGSYNFLSNFSDSRIALHGITYLNAESAFQSFKSLTRQSEFANLSPTIAKRKGKTVDLRADWEAVKDDIMYQVVRAKFKQNIHLSVSLLATGDEELIEGNTWNDTYWGVCRGKGKNTLGKILMQVRQELRTESFSPVDLEIS